MKLDNNGQALVEFAVMSLLLITLAVGIFEFSRAWFHINALNNGVRAGLRYASGLPSLKDDDPRVQSYIFGQMSSATPASYGSMRVTTDVREIPVTGKNMNAVTIRASCDFDIMAGHLFDKAGFSGTKVLERSGTMYYERTPGPAPAP